MEDSERAALSLQPFPREQCGGAAGPAFLTSACAEEVSAESGERQAKVSVSFPASLAGAGKQPGTVLALGET